MDRNIGMIIVVVGLAIVVIGLLVAAGAFSWFGRLPGDIRFERGGTRVYFPLTSMILISAVLTVILNLGRLWR